MELFYESWRGRTTSMQYSININDYKIMSLLELEPDIGSDGGLPVNNPKGQLSLKGVEFTYQMRPEEKVLKGYR